MDVKYVPLIFDFICILIIGLGILFGYLKGFLSALIELVGQILAVVVGGYLSSAIANFVFDRFMMDNISKAMLKSVENSTEINSIIEGLEKAISDLPWFLSGTIQNNLSEIFNNFRENAAEGSLDLINMIVEISIRPIIVGLITMLTFTLIFTVISFLVRITSSTASHINKLPLLGSANKTMGGIIGAVKGILVIFVFAAVITIFINMSAGQFFINNDLINSSYIFKYVYKFNPFNLIDTL